MRSDCSALVVFGITGDLARKKIFGALYDLAVLDRLDMPVIGVGRSDWSDEKLRTVAEEAIRAAQSNEGSGEEIDEATLASVLGRLSYVRGDYDAAQTYVALGSTVETHSLILCYLAVPPTVFGDIVEGLAATGMASKLRLLIEKPFGSDLESARKLRALIRSSFDDEQVFAVDHYMHKEALQNVMVLRFTNRIFEPTWCSDHIQSISIVMAEEFGVEGRAGFFDRNGTIRDVVQNHVLQIVTALAMEAPASPSAADVNDNRVQLLASIAALGFDDVVLGQYEGYLGEEGVEPGSTTDTFVQARIAIDNQRWTGVEWTISAGKALAETLTEIRVTFRSATAPRFVAEQCEPEPNRLVIQMTPNESAVLTLQALSETLRMGTAATELATDFDYRSTERLSAYARVLDAARHGDQTQFARSDVVEQSWRIVDGILNSSQVPEVYAQGSWGPRRARLAEVFRG